MCVLSLNPNSLFSVNPHLGYFVVANTVVYPTAMQGCNSLSPREKSQRKPLTALPTIELEVTCNPNLGYEKQCKVYQELLERFSCLMKEPPEEKSFLDSFFLLPSFLVEMVSRRDMILGAMAATLPTGSDKCKGIMQKMVELKMKRPGALINFLLEMQKKKP